MKKILFFIFSTMVVVNGCNSQNNKEVYSIECFDLNNILSCNQYNKYNW